MDGPKVRILIADDHDVMRRGLKSLVESHAGWAVCAEARTGREAVELAKKFKPEVAVLDITMPELNGIEAARRIGKVSRGTEVLMLSVHYSDQLVQEVIESGARGYVVKSDSDRDLKWPLKRFQSTNLSSRRSLRRLFSTTSAK
jgi:DNA-binding NarL/FixJ family response regulator